MNKRRLLKLADLLEADAKNKKGICFNLALWGEVDDEDKPLSCGTTACAMGLAALSGAFKRAGLGCFQVEGALKFTWNGRRLHGMNAARKLFDISMNEVCYLFISQSDLPTHQGAAGERAVAQRIRNFAAGKNV